MNVFGAAVINCDPRASNVKHQAAKSCSAHRHNFRPRPDAELLESQRELLIHVHRRDSRFGPQRALTKVHLTMVSLT